MSDILKWVVRPTPDPDEMHQCAKVLGIDPVVVTLAMQRGYVDLESLEEFFYPRLKDLGDPFALPGVAAAVKRIFEAVDAGESVVLYGDYDVDGVSSIALLSHILSAYGISPRCFLPTRLEEGYGLSAKGIENSFEGSPPSLLIAADCGTNSRQEAAYLKEKGIDLIILDHHEASSEGVANCVALVNPKLGNDHHYLCTAGVVFKVAHALLKTRPLAGFDLKNYLDLVALATIADIVPLEGENRIFARRGLMQLDQTIHPGLVALKAKAGVSTPARSQDVGFKLGPRLNAAGRLDTASASLDLLLCQDPEKARSLADLLDGKNKERQALELKTREEAEKIIADLTPEQRSCAIIVGARGWHPGVVGIVASRIARQYHRPTFVIGIDETGYGKGSGRSVPGISLVQAIESASNIIESGGGHEMAAGVGVREENIESFRKAVIKNVTEQADEDTLIPKLNIDVEIEFQSLSMDLLDSYEMLRPFGASNPQPLLMSRSVRLMEEPRVIKERHLKFRFEQNGIEQEGIFFNCADQKLPKLPWDIAYTVDKNEWRGRVKLNMILKAIRAST